jgi:hypothetical protein
MLSGCDRTPESGEARKLAAEEMRKLAAEEMRKLAAEEMRKLAAEEMRKLAAGNVLVEDQSGSAVGKRSRCQSGWAHNLMRKVMLYCCSSYEGKSTLGCQPTCASELTNRRPRSMPGGRRQPAWERLSTRIDAERSGLCTIPFLLSLRDLCRAC